MHVSLVLSSVPAEIWNLQMNFIFRLNLFLVHMK